MIMFEVRPEDDTIKPRLLGAQAPESIKEAAALLRDGMLVVFPTDTVYGIGADCFDNQAILNLYRAKGRPLTKGLPVLLADLEDIGKVVSEVGSAAEELINRFWPGPLTLILKKRERLPLSLSPNSGIAVRIPDSDIARALIRASGGAVASSSANLAGQSPALSPEEVDEALARNIAVIIDGGRVDLGRPSTVVDCREDPPLILRPGPLSPNLIFESSNNHL